MGLKIIENYDSSFTLSPENKEILFKLLTNEVFIQQLTQQVDNAKLEFTELIFQPVPYSSETPKGMPRNLKPIINRLIISLLMFLLILCFKQKSLNPVVCVPFIEN